MVGKSGCKVWIFGVGLRVIPADAIFTAKYAVTVVENLAICEIKEFKNTQFKAVVEMNATSDERSAHTVGIETQCSGRDFSIPLSQ